MTIKRVLALFIGVLGAAAGNSQVWQHRLTVAANPVLLIDNRDVDVIVRGMNDAIRASVYGNPWDFPCEDVQFVRAGDVIVDERLPITGSFESITAKMKSIAPRANVLIVSGIDCAGIQAAGCGRIGGEPLVVGPAPGFDIQLWLHERGHNMGLQHSAEAPAMSATEKPEIGKRFMFWMLGRDHVGKTNVECNHFKLSSVSSVSKLGNTNAATLVAVADKSGEVPQAKGAQAESTPSALAAAVDSAGMTPRAYEVVAPPWVHGLPLDVIKTLSEDDLESIRRMLEGPVNRYWPQALNVIAAVGRESDSRLVRNAMELPMAAVLPGGDLAEKEKFRTLLQVKLSAPLALGVIANRFQSNSAVDALVRAASVAEAKAIVGTNNPEALSKQALRGLSLANTPESNAFIGSVTKSNGVGSSFAIPSLTSNERAALIKNSSQVNSQGIEAYLRKPGAF
ncbi:hypothetical protein [Pseudorhodoferax soli]|uniref:Uncharacterized protein n=1 Tax=Pseudorhodoferax soli TaxID=545864 RepID=A0A368YDY9_9BURK|nr:hypothetical protein [Pseudorhodoferax soli]RCW76394.1 hypothetical protein DES41_1011000 [Pseudorhodoferax soli]